MFFRVVLCVLLVIFPLNVLAQTAPTATVGAPLHAVPPGDDNIVSVDAGKPAPFTGQLFDQPTAVRWGNYLQQCHVRLIADVQLQQKLDQAQIDYLTKVVALEQQKYTSVVTDYQQRLTKAQTEAANPPFYRTAWFGLTIGVVGTIALAAVTAWLVTAVTK